MVVINNTVSKRNVDYTTKLLHSVQYTQRVCSQYCLLLFLGGGHGPHTCRTRALVKTMVYTQSYDVCPRLTEDQSISRVISLFLCPPILLSDFFDQKIVRWSLTRDSATGYNQRSTFRVVRFVVGRVWPLPGFHTKQDPVTKKDVLVPCAQPASRCKGYVEGAQKQQCAPGYGGPLCGGCETW